MGTSSRGDVVAWGIRTSPEDVTVSGSHGAAVHSSRRSPWPSHWQPAAESEPEPEPEPVWQGRPAEAAVSAAGFEHKAAAAPQLEERLVTAAPLAPRRACYGKSSKLGNVE